jgi:uncharacterized caspase-like protein
MRRILLRTIMLLAVGCGVFVAHPAAWGGRYALVIGNNTYPDAPLRSAVNDARDFAAALRPHGFEVLLAENVTREHMFSAIREFGSRLREGDIALFFYAGHAIQLRDRNYLIPVDAKVKQEDDVSFYSLDVVEVLQRMDRARTRANLLILDACRDNPFATSVRLSAVGLAQMNAPPGTLIAYATAPGHVAQDGVGRNGTYTKHLLRHMNTPEVPVELVLKRVREGVIRETRGQQVPWDSSSLRSDVVLAGDAQTGASQPAVQVPVAGAPSSDARLSLEKTFWESIKDSRDPKEFEAYLSQFPEGVFALLARTRLENLRPARPAHASSTAASVEPSAAATASTPFASQNSGTAPAGAPAADASTSATTLANARSTVPALGGDKNSKDASPGSASFDPGAFAPITLSDGSIYRGPRLHGVFHGYGRLEGEAMGIYVGEFANGVRQGRGDQRWPNGNRYVGEFEADAPHGHGQMVFANGDRFDGNFEAGKRHGKGAAVFANGIRFTGDFRDDRAIGTGVVEFADGARYEGEVVDGIPNGKGRYQFPDGSVYAGEFRAGKMSGMGTHVFSNGDRHEGSFEAGWPSGAGVRFFAAGGRFEGVFSDQGRAATGKLFEPTGGSSPGRLENGIFRSGGG